IVAGRIIAVLHELDGMAEERAAVQAADESLHHLPGTQLQSRDAGDGFRMQEAPGVLVFICHGVLSLQMSNSKCRMNAECATPKPIFVILHLSFLRRSAFDVRHSSHEYFFTKRRSCGSARRASIHPRGSEFP